jgi:hypothetical protein
MACSILSKASRIVMKVGRTALRTEGFLDYRASSSLALLFAFSLLFWAFFGYLSSNYF